MSFWNIFDFDNNSSSESKKKCKKKCKKKICKYKFKKYSSHSKSSTSSKSSSHHKKKCPNLLKLVKEEIYKFKLISNTLPFTGCIAIPNIIKKYFKSIGYKNIKKIIESVPIIRDDDPILERQYAINSSFAPVSSFNYKGKYYNIRLSLFFSTGLIFYDSLLYNEYGSQYIQLLTIGKFPEVERSTETRWSSMQRTISSEISNLIEGTWQFYAFWIPLVKITEITSENTLGPVNNEVVCVRFGIQVDSGGKPIPVVV